MAGPGARTFQLDMDDIRDTDADRLRKRLFSLDEKPQPITEETIRFLEEYLKSEKRFWVKLWPGRDRDHNNTIVHLAAKHPDGIKLIEVMLRSDNPDVLRLFISPNRTERRTTPIEVAAMEGNVEAFKAIYAVVLEKNPDYFKTKIPELIYLAASSSNRKMLSALVELGINLDSKDEMRRNQTALHWLAHKGNDNTDYLRNMSLLLEMKADPNVQDVEGRTPLHLAAAAGNVEAIKRLVAAGADVNCKDKNGKTYKEAVKSSLYFWQRRSLFKEVDGILAKRGTSPVSLTSVSDAKDVKDERPPAFNPAVLQETGGDVAVGAPKVVAPPPASNPNVAPLPKQQLRAAVGEIAYHKQYAAQPLGITGEGQADAPVQEGSQSQENKLIQPEGLTTPVPSEAAAIQVIEGAEPEPGEDIADVIEAAGEPEHNVTPGERVPVIVSPPQAGEAKKTVIKGQSEDSIQQSAAAIQQRGMGAGIKPREKSESQEGSRSQGEPTPTPTPKKPIVI